MALSITININCHRLLPLAILLNICLTSFSDPWPSEADILLKFKDSISNNAALSDWNTSRPPCPNGNWAGVICLNDTVWGLRLQNMGLKGSLKMEILKDLTGLRTMNVMGNEFDGHFPNLSLATALKSVYLSGNKFSGEINADAFSGMYTMKKLYAAHNELTGSIPASLTGLPRLMELMLENNQFTGQIPNFTQERLKLLNVSNNELDGPIPENVAKFGETAFLGNRDLCGGPLPACPSMAKLSVGTVVLSVIVVVAALAAIIAACVILRCRKQAPAPEYPAPEDPNLAGATQVQSRASSPDLNKLEQGSASPAQHSSASSVKNGKNSLKLTFLRDDRERFDLSDLLKASAEILGSGVFGSTYKAALDSCTGGPTMVVKRYRQMNNVGKEEFIEHMRRLGRLRHANLLPLVAFYYRKEEKLLVSDYVSNVSLAVHLHGNHGRGLPSPDWPKRLKIVKGIGRGLQYLYSELPSIIAPHGHLKSSNVLLSDSWEPLLTDYALSSIVNQEHAQDLMIAYKSPEYKQLGRITKKTDVWSLGILILEILTGRFPTNTIQQGKGSDIDLAMWVQSIAREDWMTEVFDKDMGGKNNCEVEMVKLLQIGLSCCEPDVEKRWDMKEVVERIEEVEEKDGHENPHNHNNNASRDEDFYSTYAASEADMRSPRGLSDDFSNSATRGIA